MKSVITCVLTLWVGSIIIGHASTVHQGLVDASHEGSLGGILVGLALCAPLVGIFFMMRGFNRWQRGFHGRMQTDGVAFRRAQP